MLATRRRRQMLDRQNMTRNQGASPPCRQRLTQRRPVAETGQQRNPKKNASASFSASWPARPIKAFSQPDWRGKFTGFIGRGNARTDDLRCIADGSVKESPGIDRRRVLACEGNRMDDHRNGRMGRQNPGGNAKEQGQSVAGVRQRPNRHAPPPRRAKPRHIPERLQVNWRSTGEWAERMRNLATRVTPQRNNARLGHSRQPTLRMSPFLGLLHHTRSMGQIGNNSSCVSLVAVNASTNCSRRSSLRALRDST